MVGELFYKQMLLFREYYKKTLLLTQKYKNQLYLVGDRGETLAASLYTAFDFFQRMCSALFFQAAYFLEGQEMYEDLLTAFRECTQLQSRLMEIFADCKCGHAEPDSGRELLLTQADYKEQLLTDTVSLWEAYKGKLSETEDVLTACNTVSKLIFDMHGVFFSALAGFGSDVYSSLCICRNKASYGYSRIINSYYPRMEKVGQL